MSSITLQEQIRTYELGYDAVYAAGGEFDKAILASLKRLQEIDGQEQAARREALELAAVTAWNHYMDAARKSFTSASTMESWCAASAIRALITKEQQ